AKIIKRSQTKPHCVEFQFRPRKAKSSTHLASLPSTEATRNVFPASVSHARCAMSGGCRRRAPAVGARKARRDAGGKPFIFRLPFLRSYCPKVAAGESQ